MNICFFSSLFLATSAIQERTQNDLSPTIWLLPFLAALIGWLTNFLAVKMLFHPQKPFNVFGFKVQGVFPKRQLQLAVKLGDLVADQLISSNEITNHIRNHATSDESMRAISASIENTIREKLVHAFPMLSMFLSDEMIEKVTSLFSSELKVFLSKSVDELSLKIESEINIKEMVQKKVEEFSARKVEELLFDLMKKEFKFIELFGGILGFLIGSLQVILMYAS